MPSSLPCHKMPQGSYTTTKLMDHNNNKKHFLLVHGFGLGAWCWYKLLTLIKINGHHATALDLAGCGIHPNQTHQISSVSHYAHPLMDFLAALPDDQTVILVAHSYGGIPAALAMENFPGKVSLAVFITAYMPDCRDPPGSLIQEFFKRSSTESLMDCEITFQQSLPISAIFGPDYLQARVFSNCPAEDLELCKMLLRPNGFFLEELGKKPPLSETRYGRIKRCYVMCKNDQVMSEEFQRYIVDKNPPEEVVAIEGAGHMVMLSKPHQLSSCLLELAQKYA